jgi:glycosyltransferase involved in cell wall biosynthesis
MRIGVNCFLLQAHIGGLKQYAIALFNWLLENDSDNEYVLFYCKHNIAELDKLVSSRWRPSAVLIGDQREIAAHFKSLDVYFCPFGALWPRPVPVPSVVTLVDIQEVFYPQFFSPMDLFNRAYHFSSSTRAADRVVTISGFSKDTIAKYHDIDPSKIVVAYLCADPSYLAGADSPMLQVTTVPLSRFVFFPANRWQHKNHDVLLRALRILCDRGEETHAVFTGFDMPGGYPVLEKATEYSVRNFVHIVGYVNVEQMRYLYRTAEMLIFPSLFEGFGMPPVEAMATGCPAVVSRATCLPEICGDAAEYFDPHSPESLVDAICRIRHDAALREQLVARGKVRAGQFSAERMAEAHIRAFREAVETYSPAHFRWHQLAYQPFHRARVHAQRVLGRFDMERRSHQAGPGRIVFFGDWYGAEYAGPDWLRWCTGRGRLSIRTPRPVTVDMNGQLASALSPNVVRLVVNGRPMAEWTIDRAFEFSDLPAVEIRLKAGNNILEFVSSLPGMVPGPHDGRTLAMAVKNLRFTDDCVRRLLVADRC